MSCALFKLSKKQRLIGKPSNHRTVDIRNKHFELSRFVYSAFSIS